MVLVCPSTLESVRIPNGQISTCFVSQLRKSFLDTIFRMLPRVIGVVDAMIIKVQLVLAKNTISGISSMFFRFPVRKKT